MRTTKVILLDDIDGAEGDDVRNVTFALDGREFEIDLSPANAAKLEKALKPYVDAARPTKRKRSGKRPTVA